MPEGRWNPDRGTGPGNYVAETISENWNSREVVTQCELRLKQVFPTESEEDRGNVYPAGPLNIREIQPLIRCHLKQRGEEKNSGCSFLSALPSSSIVTHCMNLARNQSAEEPGNCSFQCSTSYDTENRESVRADLRATRQMISTDPKRK